MQARSVVGAWQMTLPRATGSELGGHMRPMRSASVRRSACHASVVRSSVEPGLGAVYFEKLGVEIVHLNSLVFQALNVT